MNGETHDSFGKHLHVVKSLRNFAELHYMYGRIMPYLSDVHVDFKKNTKYCEINIYVKKKVIFIIYL